MKTILLFLALSFSYFVWSQNPDLFNKNWIVSAITVNGVTTVPNYNPVSFPYVELTFYTSSSGLVTSSNQVTGENCEIGFNGHLNFSGSTDFTFSNITLINNATNCTTDCSNFTSSYISFFDLPLGSNFHYLIEETTVDLHTLTVTNVNGANLVLTDYFFNPTPEPIDRNWTLSYMIINGETIFPDNYYNLFYTLTLNNNLFNTHHCNAMVGSVNFFEDDIPETIGRGNLYLYDSSITLTDYCTTFEQTYLTFYMNNVPQAFQYEFLVFLCPCPDELHITDVNGTVAVYFDATMSTVSQEVVHFSLFPNPAQNQVSIQNTDALIVQQVELYNYLGQKVMCATQSEINISHLNTGFYTVQIHWNNGLISTSKLIKS